MNIIIDDNVKENLRIRDKVAVTVDYGILSSCWSIMPQVFLSLEGPEDSDDYTEHQVGKMKVFIKNDLVLEDEIRIRYPEVASDLSGKEFEVVGVTPPVQ